MAIRNTSKTKPGPKVNGKETLTSIFPTTELGRSAFLPNLVHTINAAFGAAHNIKPELLMQSQGDRLGSTEEFLANLSTDPESFVLVISYLESDEVIATASYRRFYGPARDRPIDRNTPWLRTLEVDPDTEEWELKLMATDVKAQGNGLAGYMMKVGEDEIQQRFQQKLLEGRNSGSDVPRKLKMIICTPLELTGQFYLRRGYTLDYQTWRGEGYNFHIAFMHKMIDHNSNT
ncbi:Putative acyl-CoA N-acyltransferase [Septoria linicola]|uniref:Acyl-CoA N-acyltransferase n=1 Tax=Septoria linicola TaxID=215465 RepID=A0A9Q9EI74_9PEZI|nr:putative acyl-CoA N-acyltransferase [Septoria linicola]USW50789.1 Putative acyl-CoA N-acyltransferase [Septoria linicola]